MSRKVTVTLPQRCLEHLRLRPEEQPRIMLWGDHVVLLRQRPIEECEGMFRGLLGPFEREEDRAA